MPIEFESISSGAKGYYHQTERRIAVQEGMSQVQTVKTAIHEMAHQKLHAIDPEAKKSGQEPDKQTRNGKEVEAESVAYTVCQHYGIDTSDYSFSYIAGWSKGKETPELKASLNTIRMASAELITEIDHQVQTLLQEREEKAQEPVVEQGKIEAAYRVGEQFLEVHEASDENWDYTLYGPDYREMDGGRIESPNGMTLEQAAKEIVAGSSLSGMPMEEMNPDTLRGMNELVLPIHTEEQIRFMTDLVHSGFDPRECWVGGRTIDLTAQSMTAEQIGEIQYQMQVDGIPKKLFTPEQWHEIQLGIAERADVRVYADPRYTPEQMSILHGALNAEAQGYLKRSDVLNAANPDKTPERMKAELKAVRMIPKEKTEQPGKKKSVLAELRKKQREISGTGGQKKSAKDQSKGLE